MKDIPGFDGKYAITEDGRVWSNPKRYGRKGNLFHAGKWRTHSVHHKGYLRVHLALPNGKWKPFFIHRLVAVTYLEPVEGKNQVNHKNSDKTDNRVENLEWCTGSENIRHSVTSGTWGRWKNAQRENA